MSELNCKTIAYASQAEEQVMDIYRPQAINGKLPVIVLVHGGAFIFGDQKMPLIQPVVETGVARGYLVASVDYRKSRTAIFPAALADVKAAVRYLKAHQKELEIDVHRMTIWGESAGGYLSLMTALTSEVVALNGDVTDNADYSSQVANLVSFYAPVEFYTMKSDYLSFGNEAAGAGKFESMFLGIEDIYQDKAACDKTYWKNYQNQLPRDFSLKAVVQVGGENDDKVPYLQSVKFSEDLAQVAGAVLAFRQFPEAKHEDPIFYTKDNLNNILDYLEK